MVLLFLHDAQHSNKINSLIIFSTSPLPCRRSPPRRRLSFLFSSSCLAIAARFSTMDDPSRAPASPKSPFLDYMAAASPTHFDSKHIDNKLAEADSEL
jgi:hypothetical protein